MRIAAAILLRRTVRDCSGSVATIAAAAAPVLIAMLAIVVDYGALAVQERKAQAIADVVAIVAASDIGDHHEALRHHLATNALHFTVETEEGHLMPDGSLRTAPPAGYGTIHLTTGRYQADRALPVGERFAPDDAFADAVQVQLDMPSELFFAAGLVDPPRLRASATAAAQNVAAFTIGSRLVSLNDGIVNALLSDAIGAEIDLSAMDYERLIGASVAVPALVSAIGSELEVQAISYSELLSQPVRFETLAGAMAALQSDNGTKRTLERLARGSQAGNAELPLSALFDFGAFSRQRIDAASGLALDANVFDLVNAAARAAGGGEQVAIDLAGALPGIATVRLSLKVGERPQGSAWLTVGPEGTTVRTAQTRVALELRLLDILPGLGVRLPLYVEAAQSEARLSAVACAHDGPRAVAIDARAGLLRAAIGEVSEDRFPVMSGNPVSGPATLVELPVLFSLLRIQASAQLEIAARDPDRLNFSPADIRAGRVQTATTEGMTASLAASLLQNLEVQIKPLPALAPKGLAAGLSSGLLELAQPIDAIIDTALATVGIGLGEADVTVTGARCGRAMLVQ